MVFEETHENKNYQNNISEKYKLELKRNSGTVFSNHLGYKILRSKVRYNN